MRTRISVYPNGKNHYVLMHRLIFEGRCSINMEIDHINGKPNDNRKSNLRTASHSNNMKNVKIYYTNKTGQSGVYYNKKEGKYKVSMYIDKKRINLGTYAKIEDAIAARQDAERVYKTEYRRETKYIKNGTR